MMSTPFRTWVDHVGGAATAARQLGVSTNAVHKWLQGTRRPRPAMAAHIEAVSGGRVNRVSLLWPQEAAA